jgi:23S rRNA pseudouridine2605 synthase
MRAKKNRTGAAPKVKGKNAGKHASVPKDKTEGKGGEGKSTAGKSGFGKPAFGKSKFGKPYGDKRKPAPKPASVKAPSENDPIRLNKYLSNSGVCSRREADVLISTGVVTVNDEVVTELGYKVMPGDVVKYDGGLIRPEKLQYLLLNKPKNMITTMDDPQGRLTVMSLIKGATKERLFPVGRLDRNTTGLLLFTNDGELATRLMHPRHKVRKIYHVTLGQKVKSTHLEEIRAGFELEDGFIKADEVSYVGDGSNPFEVGIEIHSGRNRIVRRIFEHFGYTVVKLDRVVFANLTKKDLPRGRYRLLTKEEIGMLYMTV